MLSVAKYLTSFEVRATTLDPWGLEVRAPANADCEQNGSEMSPVRCLFAKQVPNARVWQYYRMASDWLMWSSSSAFWTLVDDIGLSLLSYTEV